MFNKNYLHSLFFLVKYVFNQDFLSYTHLLRCVYEMHNWEVFQIQTSTSIARPQNWQRGEETRKDDPSENHGEWHPACSQILTNYPRVQHWGTERSLFSLETNVALPMSGSQREQIFEKLFRWYWWVITLENHWPEWKYGHIWGLTADGNDAMIEDKQGIEERGMGFRSEHPQKLCRGDDIWAEFLGVTSPIRFTQERSSDWINLP